MAAVARLNLGIGNEIMSLFDTGPISSATNNYKCVHWLCASACLASLADIREITYKKQVDTAYHELTRLIERLHRRFLDVIRAELNRQGIKDLNAVQALLLTNIGDEEIVIRDLIERGYYQGSNVSYNMKKLAEAGYIEQRKSDHDKRSVTIKLTAKARDMCKKIEHLEERNASVFAEQKAGEGDVETVRDMLRNLERIWSDYINYGR